MLIKLLIYIILTVSGLFLFKSSGSNLSLTLNSPYINIQVSFIALLGIFFYGLSFLLWINIIKENNLSYIFPIANGLVAAVIVIGGYTIFHEKMQLMQLVGIIMIILGVFFINYFK